MSIEKIIERECPRYKKEVIHMGTAQAIVDTHSYQQCPLKIFDLDDESIDVELDKMNLEYENYLRDFLSKLEAIQ